MIFCSSFAPGSSSPASRCARRYSYQVVVSVLPSRLRAASRPASGAMPPHGDGGERFAEVVVVRHGETSWNASRMIQGHMDPELNEIGRQQAVVVAHRLSRETKPAAVYSSDLKRAAETAETIAKACDVSKLVLDEGLRERHMGHLQGVKWDDAFVLNPGAFKGFDVFEPKKDLDFDYRDQEIPGGGESLNQLAERCVSCLNKIARQHIGERVIVVSHGAAIVELCRHTDPPGSSVRRNIPNTSLSVFHVSGVTGQWVLVSWRGSATPATSTGSALWRMRSAATGCLPKETSPTANTFGD